MPLANSRSSGIHVPRSAASANACSRVARQVPDMQAVTQGWWTLREERRSVEELEQADREATEKGWQSGYVGHWV